MIILTFNLQWLSYLESKSTVTDFFYSQKLISYDNNAMKYLSIH